MLDSLAGRLEGTKVTQDLVRVHLNFQSHWGIANSGILEARLSRPDWPIRMEEAGHFGRSWVANIYQRVRKYFYF